MCQTFPSGTLLGLVGIVGRQGEIGRVLSGFFFLFFFLGEYCGVCKFLATVGCETTLARGCDRHG